MVMPAVLNNKIIDVNLECVWFESRPDTQREGRGTTVCLENDTLQ